MKRRWIAPFLTLFMGAVAIIIMSWLDYEFQDMLIILLGVLVGFYIIGCIFTTILNIFDRQNEKKLEEEAEGEEMASDGMPEGQVSSESR
ncbi:MAG: hypothetical protein IKM28_10630 [Lachnospiraceae bacterium]|nr:hypothetical protein [Lachnospiraceae bacterium]